MVLVKRYQKTVYVEVINYHVCFSVFYQVNDYEVKLNSVGEITLPVPTLAQAPVIKKDMVIVKRYQKTVYVEVINYHVCFSVFVIFTAVEAP